MVALPFPRPFLPLIRHTRPRSLCQSATHRPAVCLRPRRSASLLVPVRDTWPPPSPRPRPAISLLVPVRDTSPRPRPAASLLVPVREEWICGRSTRISILRIFFPSPDLGGGASAVPAPLAGRVGASPSAFVAA